jgi:hypothetical protein
MTLTFIELLRALHAPPKYIAWVGERTEAEAWVQCARPDWMLWWLNERETANKTVFVKISVAVARHMLPLLPQNAVEPLRALEVADSWLAEQSETNRIAAELAWARGVNALLSATSHSHMAAAIAATAAAQGASDAQTFGAHAAQTAIDSALAMPRSLPAARSTEQMLCQMIRQIVANHLRQTATGHEEEEPQ